MSLSIATLPGMIRDLLTTGDADSRQQNADWIRALVDAYVPQQERCPDDLAEVAILMDEAR